ncbi:hypothetical protein D1AOALGA4SA_12865 [Olavius algarvensis Delta 1 endosymbiont]|nr:hypothetical protein D1AOALGA4SA_12865 [Olavius algarvensis Delta 1 endosymbiont]
MKSPEFWLFIPAILTNTFSLGFEIRSWADGFGIIILTIVVVSNREKILLMLTGFKLPNLIGFELLVHFSITLYI